MHTLLFLTNMAFLGTYADLASCQNAMYEIYATRINIPGQRDSEVDKNIQKILKVEKSLVCIPVKKG